MTQRMLTVCSVTASLFLGLLLFITVRRAANRPTPPERSEFAQQVDLSPLGSAAVYEQGRLKSFDSFTSSLMKLVSGPHPVAGHPDGFAYLDLMLRPIAYEDANVIYVKNKPMRREIAGVLFRSVAEDLAGAQLGERASVARDVLERRLQEFTKTGLLSSRMLLDPRIQQLLDARAADLMRTAKSVQQIRTAMTVAHPQWLRDNFQIVPPPGGGLDDPWIAIDQFVVGGAAIEAGEEQVRNQVRIAWASLVQSWQSQDASGVNEAVAQLAGVLPQVNAGLYPSQQKLGWESWYFGAKNMTWVWMIYLLAVTLLVMAVVYRWSTARRLGLSVFALAFGLHTATLMLRWYVSGRWPNSNMFEAVTTAAWFGGCLAVILEIFVRRSPMRSLFALGSAVASMVALMCAHFMPLRLNAGISNKMPVLHDVWLYIHTNVIIFSYILIAMAAVSAFFYVVYRIGGGKADHVNVGGAGAIMLSTPAGESYLSESKSSAGQIFDGATMVLMELAFVMLWTGLVMGAIWADHSWGRPWGWDPKEVFALNTFIVLALLVHVRMKVRDKGLWTALLALAGCGVMLFNWIAINFVIVGLHSYA
ncbi:MAG: cytochrome c biogenesis protein CcsA [Phycisphaerales bacterium]